MNSSRTYIDSSPTTDSSRTSSREQLVFRKTAACPASSTLLSYRTEKLSRKVTELVRTHLVDCEFCAAELPLLAHHKPGRQPRAPEIPMNLRILAESILFDRIERINKSSGHHVNSEILSKVQL